MASKNKTRLRMEQLKGGTLSLGAAADSLKIESGASGSELDYLVINSTASSESISLGEANVSIELDGDLAGDSMDTATDLGGVSSSDVKVASQAAIKTYVDTAVSGSGTSFFIEDEAGNEREINNATEIKFSGTNGLGVSSSGTGSDADPYVFDVTVDANQTAIQTISNTSLALGAGENLAGIDFGTTGEILFAIGDSGAAVNQIKLEDGALLPVTDNDVDLGSSSNQFKDLHLHGTINADAGSFEGNIAMGSNSITGLAAPTGDDHAVNKAYVDAAIEGLDVKASVKVASAGTNVTLASGLANGGSLDDISLSTGDRVLLKDQTSGSENGIWVVEASGAPSRPVDFDSSSSVTAGVFVFVEEGTTNADGGFILTTDGAITVDTTALSFTQFSGAGMITAGAALTKNGNVLDVEANSTSFVIASDEIQLASGVAGDGIALASHSLSLDLNELTAADVAVATDSIAIIDDNDGNASRKESIADLITAVAGSAGALSAAAGVLSVEVDDATLEISSNALQVKEAGLIFAHMTNVNAYYQVGSSPGNNVLSSAVQFLGSSDGNPGGIGGFDQLLQPGFTTTEAQELNSGSDVQVYLNGQLLMRDFTDSTGNATFSSGGSTVGAIADYKFMVSGNPAAVSLQFAADTIEEDDIIMIKGIVG